MHQFGSQVDKKGFIVLPYLFKGQAPESKCIGQEKPAFPSQDIRQFTSFEIVNSFVIFSPEGRNGGRADLDGSIHRDGVMNPKERILQVWNRVDIGPDWFIFFSIFQVNAFEGYDGIIL